MSRWRFLGLYVLVILAAGIAAELTGFGGTGSKVAALLGVFGLIAFLMFASRRQAG